MARTMGAKIWSTDGGERVLESIGRGAETGEEEETGHNGEGGSVPVTGG